MSTPPFLIPEQPSVVPRDQPVWLPVGPFVTVVVPLCVSVLPLGSVVVPLCVMVSLPLGMPERRKPFSLPMDDPVDRVVLP